MSSVLPDPTTPFGQRVAERLQREHLIWLTTIGADGTPQPNPVWFLWDGDTMLIYNQTGARRLGYIQHNPHVALNFESNGSGGDIIVLTGTARLSPDEPSPDQNPRYVEKYHERIARGFQTPEHFATLYPVPVRITVTKVRGF